MGKVRNEFGRYKKRALSLSLSPRRYGGYDPRLVTELSRATFTIEKKLGFRENKIKTNKITDTRDISRSSPILMILSVFTSPCLRLRFTLPSPHPIDSVKGHESLSPSACRFVSPYCY
ncbi:hypothetical protein TNCV_2011071 [Trichonephila clavipes]|nr:hypothetical protein TNCV_2011071 [Trichonephila clavipes]